MDDPTIAAADAPPPEATPEVVSPAAAPDGEPITLPEGPTSDINENPALDSLLQDFEASAGHPAAEPEPPPWSEQYARFEQFRDSFLPLIADAVEQHDRAAMAASVAMLKDRVGLSDLPDAVIENALQGYAQESPEFMAAWQGRDEQPGALMQALNQARTVIAAQLGPLQDQIAQAKYKDDISAAASSLRNVSREPVSREATPAQLRQMNDAQFEAYKKSLGSGGA